MTVDSTLAALAEPTRRAVVELLSRRPLRAGELAASVGMSPPAMSRHLRVLRLHGLIEEARGADDNRVRMYALRPQQLEELGVWLDEMASFWADQLASFKAHAERGKRR
jgi:DNA-binding transcriptional ArsR family regulator